MERGSAFAARLVGVDLGYVGLDESGLLDVRLGQRVHADLLLDRREVRRRRGGRPAGYRLAFTPPPSVSDHYLLGGSQAS